MGSSRTPFPLRGGLGWGLSQLPPRFGEGRGGVRANSLPASGTAGVGASRTPSPLRGGQGWGPRKLPSRFGEGWDWRRPGTKPRRDRHSSPRPCRRIPKMPPSRSRTRRKRLACQAAQRRGGLESRRESRRCRVETVSRSPDESGLHRRPGTAARTPALSSLLEASVPHRAERRAAAVAPRWARRRKCRSALRGASPQRASPARRANPRRVYAASTPALRR